LKPSTFDINNCLSLDRMMNWWRMEGFSTSWAQKVGVDSTVWCRTRLGCQIGVAWLTDFSILEQR
jgi:hypothetical protein